MRPRSNDRGQALVEFAISFILFLTVVLGLVTLGHGFMAVNFITNAARDGARVAATWPDRGACGILQNTGPIGERVKSNIAVALGSAFIPSAVTVSQDPAPSGGPPCTQAQTPTVQVKVAGCMHYMLPLPPNFSGSCSAGSASGFAVERTVVFHDEGLGG
jgi:Flp pilus assembly protein TadG